MALLPPAPVGTPFGAYEWADWYLKIRNAINDATAINHNDTQNIQGGTSGERYHLTAGQHASVLSIIADQWTYVVLESDFSTDSTTAQNVTGLAFTPDDDSTYVIEGFFLLRSADATVAPQPGVTWPTNLVDGAYIMQSVSSATGMATQLGNVSTSGEVASTAIPDTTNSWPGRFQATIITDNTTSGNVQITLARE